MWETSYHARESWWCCYGDTINYNAIAIEKWINFRECKTGTASKDAYSYFACQAHGTRKWLCMTATHPPFTVHKCQKGSVWLVSVYIHFWWSQATLSQLIPWAVFWSAYEAVCSCFLPHIVTTINQLPDTTIFITVASNYKNSCE